MTRRRSSPLGLELVVSVVLALVTLALLSHGAPVQDSHAELQRYSEGCYYNYNHYSEGDRIVTNEPCLNCTCHNRMLMCYLRVCPFTKSIGQDCTVEKREDQCCPIITCPEVPVDVSHHHHQLTTHAPGTELSIPEKYGCSIDSKFYPEGAQVPSNPNKPCELCYCIKNRTSCLMQECTLHIDGCQPIYNKGSCCPVRYSCDHENELLELEDFSTTTTTVRPTPGYILSSTMSPPVTTDCVHNKEVYADGTSITGKNACEHCYCMRGDIVCAVQECEMPTLESGAKTCRALPPAEGECCPSNYVCDDDTAQTEVPIIEELLTTIAPNIQSDLHDFVSQEDLQLQEHIDDKIATTEVPDKSEEHLDSEHGSGDDSISAQATVAPILSGTLATSGDDKKSQEEEENPLTTTVSEIKETRYETTQASIELTPTQRTEEGLGSSHIIIDQDKEHDLTQAPIEDEIINEDMENEKYSTTIASAIEDVQKVEEEGVQAIVSGQDENTAPSEDESEEDATTTSSIEVSSPHEPSLADEQKPFVDIDATTITPIDKSEQDIKGDDVLPATGTPSKADIAPDSSTQEEFTSATSAPTKAHIIPNTTADNEESSGAAPLEHTPIVQSESEDKSDQVITDFESSTSSSPVHDMVTEGEDGNLSMPEIGDHKTEVASHDKKPKDEDGIGTDSQVSDIDDSKKSGVPSVDSTTILSAVSEEDDNITSRPLPTDSSIEPESPITSGESEESEESSNEAQDLEDINTSTPSIIKDDVVEDIKKPIEKEGEIPAIAQEVTKPATESIPKGDADTTALPIEDSSVEESEEQTSSEEDQSKESVYTQQDKEIYSTINTPIVDEGESTLSPSRGEPVDSESDNESPTTETEIDASTSVAPSDADTKAPTSGEVVKGQSEQDINVTTIVPSVDDSKAQSAEKQQFKPEQSMGVLSEESTSLPSEASPENITTSIPSLVEGEKQISEEESHKQPEVGIAGSAASISGEETTQEKVEHDAVESSTQSVASSSVDADGVSKLHSEQNADYVTLAPSAADGSKVTSVEDITDSSTIASHITEIEEDINVKPEQGVPDSTTTDSSAVEPEVDIEAKPGQGIVDLTTVVSSVAGSDDIKSSEESESEEEIKGKPEQKISDVVTEGAAVSEDEKTEGHPEQDIADSATIASPVAGSEEKTGGEQVHKIVDFTTIAPSSNSDEQGSGDRTTGQPQDEIIGSTIIDPSNVASSVTDSEQEIKLQTGYEITDSTTIASSGTDVEEQGSDGKFEKQTELGIVDSTTLSSSITGSWGQASVDSTPVSPLGESEEEIESEQEHQVISSSPIAITADEELPSENDIKKHPEQTADTTTTVPSVGVDSEAPSVDDESIEKQPEQDIIDSTTDVSPAADSGVVFKGKPDQVSTTLAPSVTNSELLSAEEEIVKEKPTSTLDFEQPSTSANKTKQEDIRLTTLSPISSSEDQSTEIVEDIEGSGDHFPEIIPSAIPGEGDCLVNGRTFANNDTIPASNECELSCVCVSSVVVCQKVKCIEPQQPNNCVLDEASTERCCPQYICGIDSLAEDQRPTTATDIEDEEIQFTTLAPTKIYPEIAEHVSAKPGATTVAPIAESEDSATEDVELPVVTPAEAMSHINDDAVVDVSTELSSFAEQSTEVVFTTDDKIPSATSKPTEGIFSDIDHITQVPDHSIPSQKPAAAEESSTLKTAHNEPSAITSTESSIVIGGTKIDESILATERDIESESTTIKPTILKPDTEAPSLTSVLGLEGSDSDQSEEGSESPAQSSNESGEESGEDTEETKLTTASPISSEQSTINTIHTDLDGEIKPHEDTTILHEGDYQKPAMPEDMSHTKIDETEMKKPVISEGLEESEESTEKTSEGAVPPPKAPISTVLTLVESSEKDHQPVDTNPEISDKKDVFSVTEPSISEKPLEALDQATEEKPLSSTIASVANEGERLSGTVASVFESAVDKDDIVIQTIDPVSKVDQVAENVASQTTAPVNEDQQIAGTVAPISGDQPDDQSSPSIDKHQVSGTVESTLGNESEEDNLEVVNTPITGEQTITEMVAENSSEESEEHDSEVVSQTTRPDIEQQQSARPVSEIENEGIAIPTSTPAEEQPIAGTISSGSEIEAEDLASQTSAPIAEEQPIAGTIASESGDESEEQDKDIHSQTSAPGLGQQPITESIASGSDITKDDIASQTSAPTVEEQPIEGAITPVSGEESEEQDKDIHSQTSTPGIEQQPIAGTIASGSEITKDDIGSQTSAPTVEEQPIEGAIAPVSGEESEEQEQDKEIHSQTSAPVIEQQPIAETIASGSEITKDDIASQTSAPTGENQLIAGAISPVSGEESEEQEQDKEIHSQTSAPGIEQQPIAGTIASGSEITKDDIASQTSAPTGEDQPIAGANEPVSGEESEEQENEIHSQTSAPGIEQQPIAETVPSGSELEKDVIASQTSSPVVEEQTISETVEPVSGEKESEKQDNVIHSQTSVPDIEQQQIAETNASDSKIEIDYIASQTSSPAVEEQSITNTVAPVSAEESEEQDNEIYSQTSAPGFEQKPTAETIPSSSEIEKDDLASQTSSPAVEGQSITNTVAPVSAEESKEQDNEIYSQTSAPGFAVKPTAETIPSGSEIKKDDLASQTSSPVFEEQPISGTIVPGSEEVEASEQQDNEIYSHTSSPSNENLPIDIDIQTGAPAFENEQTSATIAPVVGTGTEKYIDSQTNAPSFEEQPTTGVVPSASEALEEESKDRDNEIVSQTIAPTIGQQPTIAPGSEIEKEGIDTQTPVQSSEDKSDEIVSQTTTPDHDLVEDKTSSSTSSPDVDESVLSTSTEIVTEAVKPIADEKNTGVLISGNKEPSLQTLPEDGESDINATTIISSSKGEIGDGATEAPTSSTPIEDSDVDDVEVPATSVPDEKLDVTQMPAAGEDTESLTPIKAIEKDDDRLDSAETPEISTTDVIDLGATEAPSSDTTINAVEATETILLATEVPMFSVEKVEGADKYPSVPSISPISDNKRDEVEGSAQTAAPINDGLSPTKADRGSEEQLDIELSTEEIVSHTESSVSEEKPHVDKTLLSPEAALPVDQDSTTEENLNQAATDLPSATHKPVSTEEDSSGETDNPLSPEVITIDEVTSQPSKPESEDQISVDEDVQSVTIIPSVDDEIQAQTDIQSPQVDEKEQSSGESMEDFEKPSHTETSETLAQTEKPISSSSDKDAKTPSVESQSNTSGEEPVTAQGVYQTDSPDEDESSAQTSMPDDEQVTTSKPSEDASPATDEHHLNTEAVDKDSVITSGLNKEDKKEIASTITPLDVAQTSAPSASQSSVAPAGANDTTASSGEIEVGSTQTETPNDEVKIQTIAEFVTERVEEQITELPVLDTKKDDIAPQSIATSSEEISTSSSEEEEDEEEKPEVSTDKIVFIPSAEESDEKTPAPEIPFVISEIAHKPVKQSTESGASDKPIVPVDTRFDTDLPKPMDTDKETSDEEEIPLVTTLHPLYPHIELDHTTSRPALNTSDKIDDEIHAPDSTSVPTYTQSSTLAPRTEQSTTAQSVTSAPTTHYQPPGYVPPQYPAYPEDEYTDEDETEVFGPGTCRYGGKLFVSAQQIPRDDPCDFCFCFRSDIICLQQSCPPPISGCHEEPISGFCCPRYECPVSMATVLNITTSTTTTSTTLPPHFLHHAYRGAAEKNGCHINGQSYRVGDKIDSASGPCMHCTCGGDGQMKCDPKTCSPEPMLRQMIAVVASRRR